MRNRCIAILFAIMMSVVFAGERCLAAEVYRGAEFFLYNDAEGCGGRTDFFSGCPKDWDVENRVAYLQAYADFNKKYFGDLKLDEYKTGPEEVERIISNLKPQPEPLVRREQWLEQWRYALSDEGESLGWSARAFDDSSWETTQGLPHVVKGTEERDLWMRTTVHTGDYEKAFMAFDGILGQSELWVNGEKVVGPDAIHDTSAPFRVDLTTWLDKNSDNQITVHVRDHKQRGQSKSPDEPSKYIGWGFVARAALVQTGAVVIRDVFVQTTQLDAGAAELQVEFTLDNFLSSQFDGSAEVSVRKWFPDEAQAAAAQAVYPVSVMAGSGAASPLYYALDFGPEDSPVATGFERVTNRTRYDADKGFGWKMGRGLAAVDNEQVAHVQPVDADLKRDAVEGTEPVLFKLKTGGPGTWGMEFMIGSPEHKVGTTVTYIDTEIVGFKKDAFKPWEFSPVNATVFVRAGAAELKIESGNDEPFALNGLVAMNGVPRVQRFRKLLGLKSPAPWWPESPNLYELRITIKDEEGAAMDDAVVTFGVVTLEDRGGDLFVNGRQYRMRGALETHSFPPERDDDLTCIAPPDKWIVQDIADNRSANMNLMRFHPAEALGTNYRRWLEFADQMGMFMIWSPRQWFHWEHRAVEDFLPLLEAYTEPSMKAVRNHPSIFAWESGNETYYNGEIWDARARAFSDTYYDLANSIDPSRFILPISFWYAQFEGKADFYRKSPARGNEISYPGSGKSPRSFWASNVFWDIHPYPGWYGGWFEIWWDTQGGHAYTRDKIFMVSEFGAEGMPNWELYRDERYYHVWEESGSKAAEHELDRLGRNLEFSEWQVSQAYQALVMYNDIAVFRTEDADGVSICTGAEGRHNGRYFKGLRDMHRRPKLAYYVTGMAYSPVFVEGLNGDMILSADDALEPVLVNDGPARTVDLEAVFRDADGNEVGRESLRSISLPEAGQARPGKKIKPPALKSGGYYSVEFVVTETGE